MNRFSTKWLVIGAFLAVIILIANVTVTYHNTGVLYLSSVAVAHTHDVLLALEDVLSLAKDAETGQRGYIITGEESYLEPYNTAVDAINSQTNVVAALTSGNPRQQARITELRSRLAAKLDELNRTIIIRRTSGAEAARSIILSGQGKSEMEAIRGIVGEMIEEETRQRNERLYQRDRAYAAAISEGLFSGFFAIATIFAFLLLLRRHLRERERSTFIIAEQAERFRTTLASIGDGVIATDTDGRVTMINSVAESLTGWTLADALGRPLTEIFEIVNESTRATAENPAIRALNEGIIMGLANHTILIAKDGTERPIDDSAAPIRCSDGEIVGCVLVFKDVTEQRLLEGEVRIRDEQSRSILESITDGFFALDRDWRFAYINSAGERFLDREPGDLIGKVIWDEYPGSLGSEFEQVYRRVANGGEAEAFTAHYPDLDRWYQVNAYPAKDGLSVYFRDVTVHKLADKELRASEERLAFVRRSSGVGFWYCDLPFDVLQWDDLVKSHFHLPPDALVTIKTFYDRIHPDDRRPTREAIEQSIAERTHYQTDYRTVNPDTGAVTWVRAIGRTFYADDGTPTRFDGVTLDVSDQKAAEAEIKALSDYNRNVLESIADPLFTLDREWRFTYMSTAGAKVVMREPGELAGKVIWDEFPGLIGSTFEPYYRRAMDGVAGRITDYYPDHDIWYEINLFPSPTGITVYFRNVSERIRREQNLAFLADLMKDFTPLSSADEILRLAGSRIVEYLGLARCTFADINEDANLAVISYDHHTAGLPDLTGTYDLTEYLDDVSERQRLAAGQPIVADDVDSGPRSPEAAARFKALGIRSLASIPYISDGRWKFSLAAFHSEPHTWEDGEMELLQALAARTYLSLERARAQEALTEARNELELRVAERTSELAEANVALLAKAEESHRAQEERVRLLGQVISSQEEERQRISRDIHDHLGGRLTALRLHLELLGGGSSDDAATARLSEVRDIARKLDADVTSIVWKLRPAAIENRGLLSALDEYVTKWSANVDITAEFRAEEISETTLSTEVQTCLYRITQEALNNVYKYAEAANVTILLTQPGQAVSLIIEDDGKGFDIAEEKKLKGGFGLIGMQERAALLGGTVEIESATGMGTTIFVRIPIARR